MYQQKYGSALSELEPTRFGITCGAFCMNMGEDISKIIELVGYLWPEAKVANLGKTPGDGHLIKECLKRGLSPVIFSSMDPTRQNPSRVWWNNDLFTRVQNAYGGYVYCEKPDTEMVKYAMSTIILGGISDHTRLIAFENAGVPGAGIASYRSGRSHKQELDDPETLTMFLIGAHRKRLWDPLPPPVKIVRLA